MVHRGLTAALLTLIAAVCAFGQGSDYEQGVARFDAGDFTGAVPLLTRATESNPRDAQAWKALGAAYAAQGFYGRAEPSFRRACELDSGLPDACYFHARALYALNRFDQSLEVLQRVAPKSWKVHIGIAEALDGLGRTVESEKEFRTGLALCRASDPAAGTAYGLFLVRQGRFAEAVEQLKEVLTRFPDAAEAHIQLGRAMLDTGDTAGATVHLERGVALAPGSGQAHLLLAKAYVRAGRPGDAQPHFEAAAKIEQGKK
jgi:Tfp pilus assembly protein PilF